MRFRFFIIIISPLVLGACSGPQLIPTPNLYVGLSPPNPFRDIPAELQGTEVDVFYATDRKPLEEEGERLEYGTERSASLAFGSCRVRIGDEDLTWEELVADSRTQDRSHHLSLTITGVEELGRFPETPLDIVKTERGIEIAPHALKRQADVTEMLHEELRRRLALTSRKDVYVFVHGVANTFESSVLTVVNLWHFFGRLGVPIVYTWPARGKYFYDRESGEFTGFHLKDFIRRVASLPEVEKIHLLAHSRGTDITTSMLQELFLEARGAKEDARKKYKIDNVVLAAPDLDLGVLLQRLSSEHFGMVIGRLTIYTSDTDRAIGLASWLFGGTKRMGRLRPEDLSPERKQRLALYKNKACFVDADVSAGFLGHSYFREHPAVTSDLILVLCEDRDPGAENGRPLIPVDVSFWKIENDYLLPEE